MRADVEQYVKALSTQRIWWTIEEGPRFPRDTVVTRVKWGAILSNGDRERAIATREFYTDGTSRTFHEL